MARYVVVLMACWLLCAARPVVACETGTAPDIATRIAQVACAEHAKWYAPFIDEAGRLAQMRVSEAENLRLRDGTPAWRRVAAYWQGAGIAWPHAALPAGADCSAAQGPATALCRTFLVDTPWSAVFVSWLMREAGVPGFGASPRHVDYVRDAWRGRGPYRLVPVDTAPAVGDMLCYTRTGQPYGEAGFRDWLARSGDGALAMHCDVVVSTANARARLVGGNVLQGVTMRLLALNATGGLWNLPRSGANDPECTPDTPRHCNLHRRDWVALLQLDPAIARSAPLESTAEPARPPCCTVCTLPLAEGVQRCPIGDNPTP